MLGMMGRKLKKETEETRKRIQFLREQMNTLGDASLVKKMADVAKMTSEVLPKDIDVEKMEDLVDEIQSSRDAIKQTTDALVGGETSNGDEELQKVLNELDGLPTVPKESPQREQVSEMEAFSVCKETVECSIATTREDGLESLPKDFPQGCLCDAVPHTGATRVIAFFIAFFVLCSHGIGGSCDVKAEVCVFINGIRRRFWLFVVGVVGTH